MKLICPNCGLTVGEQIGGRLGLAVIGLALGSRVNPWIALIGAIVGAAIGHKYIDSATQKCPQCGAALQIAAGLL